MQLITQCSRYPTKFAIMNSLLKWWLLLYILLLNQTENRFKFDWRQLPDSSYSQSSLSFALSLCLSYLSLPLSLSLALSIALSLPLSLSLSLSQPLCLLLCLSLFISLSLYLSIHVSLSLYISLNPLTSLSVLLWLYLHDLLTLFLHGHDSLCLNHCCAQNSIIAGKRAGITMDHSNNHASDKNNITQENLPYVQCSTTTWVKIL